MMSNDDDDDSCTTLGQSSIANSEALLAPTPPPKESPNVFSPATQTLNTLSQSHLLFLGEEDSRERRKERTKEVLRQHTQQSLQSSSICLPWRTRQDRESSQATTFPTTILEKRAASIDEKQQQQTTPPSLPTKESFRTLLLQRPPYQHDDDFDATEFRHYHSIVLSKAGPLGMTLVKKKNQDTANGHCCFVKNATGQAEEAGLRPHDVIVRVGGNDNDNDDWITYENVVQYAGQTKRPLIFHIAARRGPQVAVVVVVATNKSDDEPIEKKASSDWIETRKPKSLSINKGVARYNDDNDSDPSQVTLPQTPAWLMNGTDSTLGDKKIVDDSSSRNKMADDIAEDDHDNLTGSSPLVEFSHGFSQQQEAFGGFSQLQRTDEDDVTQPFVPNDDDLPCRGLLQRASAGAAISQEQPDLPHRERSGKNVETPAFSEDKSQRVAAADDSISRDGRHLPHQGLSQRVAASDDAFSQNEQQHLTRQELSQKVAASENTFAQNEQQHLTRQELAHRVVAATGDPFLQDTRDLQHQEVSQRVAANNNPPFQRVPPRMKDIFQKNEDDKSPPGPSQAPTEILQNAADEISQHVTPRFQELARERADDQPTQGSPQATIKNSSKKKDQKARCPSQLSAAASQQHTRVFFPDKLDPTDLDSFSILFCNPCSGGRRKQHHKRCPKYAHFDSAPFLRTVTGYNLGCGGCKSEYQYGRTKKKHDLCQRAQERVVTSPVGKSTYSASVAEAPTNRRLRQSTQMTSPSSISAIIKKSSPAGKAVFVYPKIISARNIHEMPVLFCKHCSGDESEDHSYRCPKHPEYDNDRFLQMVSGYNNGCKGCKDEYRYGYCKRKHTACERSTVESQLTLMQSSDEEEEEDIFVPFCNACKTQRGDHHKLCPHEPFFETSGSKAKLQLLLAGVGAGCGGCRKQYHEGKQPGKHSSKCPRSGKPGVRARKKVEESSSSQYTPLPFCDACKTNTDDHHKYCPSHPLFEISGGKRKLDTILAGVAVGCFGCQKQYENGRQPGRHDEACPRRGRMGRPAQKQDDEATPEPPPHEHAFIQFCDACNNGRGDHHKCCSYHPLFLTSGGKEKRELILAGIKVGCPGCQKQYQDGIKAREHNQSCPRRRVNMKKGLKRKRASKMSQSQNQVCLPTAVETTPREKAMLKSAGKVEDRRSMSSPSQVPFSQIEAKALPTTAEKRILGAQLGCEACVYEIDRCKKASSIRHSMDCPRSARAKLSTQKQQRRNSTDAPASVQGEDEGNLTPSSQFSSLVTDTVLVTTSEKRILGAQLGCEACVYEIDRCKKASSIRHSMDCPRSARAKLSTHKRQRSCSNDAPVSAEFEGKESFASSPQFSNLVTDTTPATERKRGRIKISSVTPEPPASKHSEPIETAAELSDGELEMNLAPKKLRRSTNKTRMLTRGDTIVRCVALTSSKNAAINIPQEREKSITAEKHAGREIRPESISVASPKNITLDNRQETEKIGPTRLPLPVAKKRKVRKTRRESVALACTKKATLDNRQETEEIEPKKLPLPVNTVNAQTGGETMRTSAAQPSTENAPIDARRDIKKGESKESSPSINKVQTPAGAENIREFTALTAVKNAAVNITGKTEKRAPERLKDTDVEVINGTNIRQGISTPKATLNADIAEKRQAKAKFVDQSISIADVVVPFCRACKTASEAAVHHALCPQHPHFFNSGAQEKLEIIRYGTKKGCPACTVQYEQGTLGKLKVGHSGKCKKLDMGRCKKQANANSHKTADKAAAKAEQSSQNGRRNSEGGNKVAEESHDTSRLKGNNDASSQMKKNKKTVRHAASVAPNETLNENDGSKVRLTSQVNIIKQVWKSCENPWGPVGYQFGDVVISGDGGFTHHEAHVPGKRFTTNPFKAESGYNGTHFSPKEATHTVKLARDAMANVQWGFDIEHHDFGGACLVQGLDPNSPAADATFVGTSEHAPLHLHDMIIAVNGKDISGWTEAGVEIEIETSGVELTLTISRYRFPSVAERLSANLEIEAWTTLDESLQDKRTLGWCELDLSSESTKKVQLPDAPACSEPPSQDVDLDEEDDMSALQARLSLSQAKLQVASIDNEEEIIDIDDMSSHTEKGAAVDDEQQCVEVDDASKADSATVKSDDWDDDDNPWVGCVCGKIHELPADVFWIQCEACNTWYNVASDCIGFNEKKAQSMSSWTCRACPTDDDDDEE